jgi:hypothetical protein
MWHYTPAYRAPSIVSDGYILPRDTYAFPGAEQLVWFTLNQEREPTASSYSATMAVITQESFQVRFGYPAEMGTPYKQLPLNFTTRRKMEKASRGGHFLWMAMSGAVSIEHAVIESNRSGKWAPITTEEITSLLEQWGLQNTVIV